MGEHCSNGDIADVQSIDRADVDRDTSTWPRAWSRDRQFRLLHPGLAESVHRKSVANSGQKIRSFFCVWVVTGITD